MTSPRICVFGAGSIGCYVGGRLAHAGAEVSFIGRERIGAELRAHGLRLTDYQGADLQVPADRFAYAADESGARDADLVLVTVKSAASAEAGAALARVLKPGAVTVSFQNGLHNAEVLRKEMPGQTVLAGMVEFNVINRGGGVFHQGSEGSVDAEAHPALAAYAPLFSRAGLPLTQHADFPAVQWAKLQLNLNNAINALADIPLKEELGQRAFRRCLALAQQELLDALEAAGIEPAQLTPLPARWLPRSLDVPDFVFRATAKRVLAIDPLARSSMWEDWQAGRRTEIDYLNGEVVKLAQAQGRGAPVNARLVALIREAERGGKRRYTGEELLAELRAAR